MPRRSPSLSALRSFEVAARHLHFGRAGEELHVTHSAISRQLRALEEELGLRLFERRNRAVFLTDAGRKLLSTMSDVLRQIAECCDELQVGAAAPLVVSCEPTFTQRWLIPRLPDFTASYPEIEVHILAAGGPIDFVRSHIDLALRRSDFAWNPDLFAETVVEERVGPVCSPHLARHADVLDLPRIHSATRRDAWARYLADQGLTLADQGGQVFEHFYLSIEAAVAGLGAAIGPEPLVADAVRSGQLVAPRGFSPNGYRYVLLSRIDFGEDSRRESFLRWLRRQVAAVT